MVEDDLREVGEVIVEALAPDYDDAKRSELSERTRALMDRYPLYTHLSDIAASESVAPAEDALLFLFTICLMGHRGLLTYIHCS